MNTTYFTQNFADLSDSRKIEVMLEQLVRIAHYNDLDSLHYDQALNIIATMREHVAKK